MINKDSHFAENAIQTTNADNCGLAHHILPKDEVELQHQVQGQTNKKQKMNRTSESEQTSVQQGQEIVLAKKSAAKKG